MILTGFNELFEALKANVTASYYVDVSGQLDDVRQVLVDFIESDERNYRKSIDDLIVEIDEFVADRQDALDDRDVSMPEYSEIVDSIQTVIDQERKRGLKVN